MSSGTKCCVMLQSMCDANAPQFLRQKSRSRVQWRVSKTAIWDLNFSSLRCVDKVNDHWMKAKTVKIWILNFAKLDVGCQPISRNRGNFKGKIPHRHHRSLSTYKNARQNCRKCIQATHRELFHPHKDEQKQRIDKSALVNLPVHKKVLNLWVLDDAYDDDSNPIASHFFPFSSFLACTSV